MRLQIQEQSELNFVSRIIQSRWVGIGNYFQERSDAGFEIQFKIKIFSVKT